MVYLTLESTIARMIYCTIFHLNPMTILSAHISAWKRHGFIQNFVDLMMEYLQPYKKLLANPSVDYNIVCSTARTMRNLMV